MFNKLVLLLISTLLLNSFCLAQPLTIMLDGPLSPLHAPIIVAAEKGFFKKQGLDVKLLSPTSKATLVRTKLHQTADLTLTSEPQFALALDTGSPLIRVGTLIDKPLNCLVALKASGIRQITDLNNKNIAILRDDSLEKTMLTALLAKKATTANIVSFSNLKTLTDALINKQVDAVVGMTKNADVLKLETKGYPTITIFPEEEGLPTYHSLILVTAKGKENDSRFPLMLTALTEAVAFLDQHPEDSWRLFIKKYPKAKSLQNHLVWLATIPYYAENPSTFEHDEWNNFFQFMYQHQLIRNVRPLTYYAIQLKSSVPTDPVG